MVFACMTRRRRRNWERRSGTGTQEHALPKAQKYTESNIACANVSLTVVQARPCPKVEKEKQERD